MKTVIEFLKGLSLLERLDFGLSAPGHQPPKFCEKCGSPLILAEYQSGYSVDTGKPLSHLDIRCPNRAKFLPDDHTTARWPETYW